MRRCCTYHCSRAHTNQALTYVQAGSFCARILLSIVCESEEGLRDPMAQVDRVPSTLSHIAIDLDLNDRALLAANAALAARARGDFVAGIQLCLQLGALDLCCRRRLDIGLIRGHDADVLSDLADHHPLFAVRCRHPRALL